MSFRRETLENQDTVLDMSSPKLDVHGKIRLFPHQQALVAKMIEMESTPRCSQNGVPGSNNNVFVLKDPPGSGKSFPLLALMLQEKRQFGRTQNLLVIPHNIHQQWLKYIADFSDELQAVSLMYYGDVTSLFYDARLLFEYDILITTSTFYDMITSTVVSIGAWFNRVILDEIDSIAFFTMSHVPSQSIWLVSASAELTKSGAYVEHIKKNGLLCDPLFIKRSINLPPPVVEHHTCFNEYVSILQKGILDENKMKSVYAVDFTPFKFEYLRNENVITNAKQLLSATFRDHCFALHSTVDAMKSLEKGAKYQSYLPEILGKKINKKNKLEKNITNMLSIMGRSKCAWCCEDFTNTSKERVVTKCCAVLLHKDCMDTFLRHSASPRCLRCCLEFKKKHDGTSLQSASQTLLDISDYVIPDIEPVQETIATGNSLRDKMEEFSFILDKEKSRNDFRILIFSDMTGTFLKVIQVLKEKGLDYTEIEGNQYTMDRAMADYKCGKKPILLVDAQSYGAGMNMEMTTAVVIMHKTERESQIIGRAQRLGRVNELYVHHLIYEEE